MSRTRTIALLGVLVAALVGGFVWRFGDSTGAVDTSTPQGADLVRGWRQVDQRLPALSRSLPGIRGAADGIPARGTYLVNLWASTCGPCRHEMPWLQRFQRESGVRVIGVTRDSRLSEALKFMAARKVTYPNVRDEYGDFASALGAVVPANALPSSLIVVDGTVTWARTGPFDSYHDLRDSVTQRL